MAGSIGVLTRVAVGRAIATKSRAAFLAGAQVHPGRADFDAFLTFQTLRPFDGSHGVEMVAAFFVHHLLLCYLRAPPASRFIYDAQTIFFRALRHPPHEWLRDHEGG